MEDSELNQSHQVLPNEILQEMIRTGLVVVGGKGVGKTNAVKVITSEIIKRQPLPIQVKCFDVASNWKWQFEPILYQDINEKTRFIYDGRKHFLYNIDLLYEEDIMAFIGKVVLRDYLRLRKLKEELEGNLMEWKLYTIEEAQNVLSSYALIRRSKGAWMKIISECRNFNMGFILIGQRMANISTSLLERCHGYLIGKLVGDNDLAKIRRICGRKSGVDETVKNLASVGQFVYWNGSSAYKFNCPKYETITRPQEWKIEEKEKKTWTWLWGKRLW